MTVKFKTIAEVTCNLCKKESIYVVEDTDDSKSGQEIDPFWASDSENTDICRDCLKSLGLVHKKLETPNRYEDEPEPTRPSDDQSEFEHTILSKDVGQSSNLNSPLSIQKNYFRQ